MKTKKKFPDLNGDGKVTMADVLKGRGVKKAGKGMKYEKGGKIKPGGSKVKSHLKDLEEGNYVNKSYDTYPGWTRNKAPEKMSGVNKKKVGNPAPNKSVKKFSEIGRGSVADVQLRSRGKSAAGFLKATQKAQEVPNKALAKKTEDFGEGYGKKTYYSGNPGGLKGQTQGKGGNVGAGVQVKKKRRR
jgi:hypothetical protein